MKRLYSFPLLALLALAGCGGSGSSGSGTTPVFLTDDPTSNFDSVQVSIEEITVLRKGQPIGGIVVKGGKVIHRDLAALHDADGPLFSYLGDVGLSVQEGDMIHLVLSADVAVHVVGADAMTTATIVGSTGGKKGYDYYASRKGITEKGIKIACDLSKWSLDGTALTIRAGGVAESAATVIRHPREASSGLATGRRTYTGGRFALDLDGVAVAGDRTTSVFHTDGTSSPQVLDGETLTVFGTYSDATGRLEADAIAIETGAPTSTFYGVVTQSADSGNGFVANVRTPSAASARLFVRFQPDQRTVPIQGGLLRDLKSFIAGLKKGDRIEAEGIYDPKTNVLTPTYLRSSQPGAPSMAMRGQKIKTKSNIKNDFVVMPTTWEGFDFVPGDTMRLTGNADTEYQVGDASVTRDEFLTSLASGGPMQALFSAKGGPKSVGYDLAVAKKV